MAANNNLPAGTKPYSDSDGNQITSTGKLLSGALLVLLTFFCLLYLIGHWPDRLPARNATQTPYYTYPELLNNIIDRRLIWIGGRKIITSAYLGSSQILGGCRANIILRA